MSTANTLPDPDSFGPGSDPLFTIEQAAAYLAIPKATIYTWRTRRIGFGPRAIKFSNSIRYRRSDLDAWVTSHAETLPTD